MKRSLLIFSLSMCAMIAIAYGTETVFNVRHDGVPQFCAPGVQVNGSTYNFIGTCAVTPPPPPAANQLTRATITYVNHGGNTTAVNADMTDWASTWGRISATIPGSAWPQTPGSTPQFMLGRTQFVCTRFRAIPTIGPNVLSMSSYNTAGNLEVSISHTCGDFAPSDPACHKDRVGAFQASFLFYGTNVGCRVTAGADHYLNIRWSGGVPIDPNPSHPLCTAAGCKVAVTSNTSRAQ